MTAKTGSLFQKANETSKRTLKGVNWKLGVTWLCYLILKNWMMMMSLWKKIHQLWRQQSPHKLRKRQWKVQSSKDLKRRINCHHKWNCQIFLKRTISLSHQKFQRKLLQYRHKNNLRPSRKMLWVVCQMLNMKSSSKSFRCSSSFNRWCKAILILKTWWCSNLKEFLEVKIIQRENFSRAIMEIEDTNFLTRIQSKVTLQALLNTFLRFKLSWRSRMWTKVYLMILWRSLWTLLKINLW